MKPLVTSVAAPLSSETPCWSPGEVTPGLHLHATSPLSTAGNIQGSKALFVIVCNLSNRLDVQIADSQEVAKFNTFIQPINTCA